MSDQIKIEELKMYVGTGLKVKIYPDGPNKDHLIEEMTLDGFEIILEGDNNCRPLVRPLSQLTIEQLKELDPVTFGGVTKYDLDDALMALVFIANSGELNLSDALKLASWHFDLFSWLNRTGPDGLPLAEVLE